MAMTIEGLRAIQQLVANAISSDVCSGANALSFLWWWNHSVPYESRSWIDAAKFLTGASAVGSMAIPIILRHAGLIGTAAMFIEFTSFFIFVCTVLCFHRASLDDEW
ncbi:uncharacterized protein LOC131001508 isoform X2 [Salvia miltiorrhiza]|uniref:uncharacterized protein LOC131001508 isoform X2 n=1 Tax=Salvia miltiorrhiza TaxID=226208 RepID=UPI0025ABAE26|nr:uncharacterized protein LOC131001508 isoform X2 [Salvia miltiorrhiza]XP_057783884.1 uncharacterized protein LOC131001508 isoform X2 [Salvia miltiorrhiza]